MNKFISKLSHQKKGKITSNKSGDFSHTFRVIPASEIESNRSKAYTYLV